MKRLELQHIENMVESLDTYPDFGYDSGIVQHDEAKFQGWAFIKDYVTKNNKYERLNNYIAAQVQFKKDEEIKQKARLLENKNSFEK